MNVRSLLVLFITVGGFSLGISFYYRLYRYLRFGKNENRFDHLPQRIKIFFINVIGQKKMFKDKKPGIGHAFVFWGFCVITIGTIEMILHGIFSTFTFEFIGQIPYLTTLFFQDIFYGLVLMSIFFFFYRRLVIKPKRLEVLSAHSSWDAYFILSLITLLMTTALLYNAASDLKAPFQMWRSYQPLSSLTSLFLGWFSFSKNSIGFIQEASWWLHLLTVLSFFCYLPFSKHLHVVAAAPNIFFTTLAPRGRLKKIDLTDETQTSFGAGKLEDFSWKQLLDSYACTECGRCNEFCPTYNTGKSLKPRSLIVDLRHHLEAKGKALLTKKEDAPVLKLSLTGDVISEDTIWDCTTCGACVEACPVFIEHVDKIVDMRRNLVLMQGKMDPEAQKVFTNFENYSNPWGLAQSARGDWAKELGIKTLSENPNVEYLFYVGCAGSYDSRAKKVSVSFAKLLLKANVSFGILGTEERCNGESCRRMGNEYLAQQLISKNIEVLQKYNIKKILTTCPHCFNTLKNEYPDFGATFQVTNHTEFLMKLIKEGKLNVQKEVLKKITYHDSCYLGRYNSIYESPRNILKSISGTDVVEMQRTKSQGFCCGAGGGRMWLEEKRGDRINVNRVEEALGTGAQVIASACPFCLTMVEDGLKAKNQETTIQAQDIAEILEAAVV